MASKKHKQANNLFRNKLLMLLFSFSGLTISVYTMYIEFKYEQKPFKAFCDFSEQISCTKAFSSKYGKGFGLIDENSPFNLPNPIFGLIHYTLMIILILLTSKITTLNYVVLIAAIVSNLLSIYLAYILYILQTICILCVSLYIINALILLASIYRVKKLSSVNKLRSSKKKD